MSEDTKNKNIFIGFIFQHINLYNTWRNSHPNIYDEDNKIWSNPVDFSRVHFNEASGKLEIIFNGWDFGGGTNFSNADFDQTSVIFNGCKFGEDLKLDEIKYGSSFEFYKCTFTGKLAFENSTIKNLRFIDCQFNRGNHTKEIIFENCDFNGDYTEFKNTERYSAYITDNDIIFNNCTFNALKTHFFNAKFQNKSEFNYCQFLNDVNFTEAEFNQNTIFNSCNLLNTSDFSATTSNVLPKFLNCNFFGKFLYSGRSLSTDFAGSTFHELPEFSTKDKEIDKLNLTDVKFKVVNQIENKWHFGFTFDRSKLLTLRSLRGVAEFTKNHDLERDLYIEERKAERGIYLKEYGKKILKGNIFSRLFNFGRFIGHLIMIIIMWVYWISSNYGRNIVLPFMWYMIFLLWQLFEYRIIFNKVSLLGIHKERLNGAIEIEKFNTLVDTLAIANNIPIVGNLSLDNEMKKFIFCGGHLSDTATICIPPEGYISMLISQNIISGVLIFLFGLSLRNYFKIK